MTPRTVAALLWGSGGACWLVGWLLVLGGTGRDETSVLLLSWVGLVLVLLGGLAAGVALVATAPWWLRAVVALGLSALLWAVLETARQGAADAVVEGVAGLVAILVAALLLVRRGAGDRRTGPGGARHRH